MKKAIKNYLAKLQENEQKGFSLVELIIVMAIMAILVGVVASQVIPYIEKSRQSKDQQVLSSLCTDVTSAIAQSGESVKGDGSNGPAETTIDQIATITNAKVATQLEELRSNTAIATIKTDVEGALKSKLMKGGAVTVRVDPATGKIAVWVAAQDSKGKSTYATLAGSGDKNIVESEG